MSPVTLTVARLKGAHGVAVWYCGCAGQQRPFPLLASGPYPCCSLWAPWREMLRARSCAGVLAGVCGEESRGRGATTRVVLAPSVMHEQGEVVARLCECVQYYDNERTVAAQAPSARYAYSCPWCCWSSPTNRQRAYSRELNGRAPAASQSQASCRPAEAPATEPGQRH